MRRGENFWLRVTTASAQCLRLSERFFHCVCIRKWYIAGLYYSYNLFIVTSCQQRATERMNLNNNYEKLSICFFSFPFARVFSASNGYSKLSWLYDKRQFL